MKSDIPPEKSSKSGIGLFLITTILLTILPALHILASHTAPNLPFLVGDRSEAIFDLWSIQHLLSGIIIGSALTYFYTTRLNWQKFALLMLVFALTWEATELAMESGWCGQAVSNWKRGFEHWGNRFIGDPLMVTIGGLITRRYKSAWKWILIPATIWLIANIASPNSMSIQNFIFG